MKKFFVSAFVALTLFAFVACESNPGIKAGKNFIKNPTKENLEKMDAAMDEMDAEEMVEFAEWWDEHEDEISIALIQAHN